MGAHWLEIQAAVPISVLAGLITEIGSKQNEATIIQSIDTSRTDRTLKMATDDNVLHTHPVETFITLGSPWSSSLFVTYSAGLIEWVRERVLGVKGFSCLHNFMSVATRM